ncbi:GDSL family lipase [Nocardioides silvaticus]|uniref:GDSL family lipase n=1 Tax=Nocardioides silvaticus TaxID=2201891 RepID=A0A316TJZ3_9ACTN|nr:SGNH/GDSL hydrolase family protein [Nocardioides silvaticus]PWN04897.1 GDSL family lipase [Nocardioides silvaticus]
MRRRVVVPLTLVAVASVLTACDSDEPDGPAPRVIRPGDAYVALGDSYTAVPGTGPNATSTGCNNTTVNYPHLVADELGLELTDNSCDGAATENLLDEQCVAACSAKDITFQKLRPPQVQGLDEDTRLVTFRLGANDYGLIGRIIGCASLSQAGTPGSPCADQDAELGEDSMEPRLRDMERNVRRGIEEVQDRAPDARIIVLGYPRIAPDEGTCHLLPLPDGDYEYARQIMLGINAALQAVADEADLTFIDMYAASEGHDVCSDDPWVAGWTPIGEPPPEGARRLHPYAAAAEAEAELVLEALKP